MCNNSNNNPQTTNHNNGALTAPCNQCPLVVSIKNPNIAICAALSIGNGLFPSKVNTTNIQAVSNQTIFISFFVWKYSSLNNTKTKMRNVYLYAVVIGFLILAIFAAVWKTSSSTPAIALADSEISTLSTTLMSTDKVLLASRTILLDDPPATRNLPLPLVVNLWERKGASSIAVDDQGPYGSCTAHAMRYAWRLWKNRLNTSQVPQLPSRTFWYAQSRIRIRENLKFDRGSTNQATVWVLANEGMVLESIWPYTKENITRPPSSAITNSARANKCNIPSSLRYFANPATTLTTMRTALAQGRSIIIAILVYSSFMTSATISTGIIPLPNTRRERLLGGHAITLTGYDFNRAIFTFRNSWGTKVGMNGLFEIPFAYIANPSLSGDAWIF